MARRDEMHTPFQAVGVVTLVMNRRHEEKFRQQLQKWRDDMVNVSRTNRLLYFRHTKTASLEVALPGSDAVNGRLSASGSRNFWEFCIPPSPEVPDRSTPAPSPRDYELVIKDKSAGELAAALRLLDRKAKQDLLDKGLRTLYLGLGSLEWIDPDDNKKVQSPLLLVPVSFSRESLHEPFQLRRTEDDSVINPTLTVKLLTDFNIKLPLLEELAEASPSLVREAVANAVREQRHWAVHDQVVLTTFTFHKEAMYRDLLDNEGEIAQHPLVQMLALGPESPSAAGFDFEEVNDDLLDEVVKPEELVSVRDADSSQRRCILAARDGHSFVMDGPPGSGKSQTIANIIAELIAAGRTVLFVSEKAAALEVVQERLKESGLDDFTLELHSHSATRKAVAIDLGRALSTRPTARSTFDSQSSSRLATARMALTQYASAMNEVRQPLGHSLHDVLGRIAVLTVHPQAPVPTGITRRLRRETLNDLLNQAEVLGRNWAPVEQGEGFVWRELRELTMSAGRRNELERRVKFATEALSGVKNCLQAIDDELRLRWRHSIADAGRMYRLLELLDHRPQVQSAWLTAESSDALALRVAELAEVAGQYHELARHLSEELGEAWEQLDASWAPRVRAALDASMKDLPPWAPVTVGSANVLSRMVDLLRTIPSRLMEIDAEGRSLAAALTNGREEMSVDRAARLGELGSLAGLPDAPESAWLNPAIQSSLDLATSVLSELLADYRARQAALAETFTRDILKLDLHALRTRFADVHHGLGKTRKAYRSDQQALAACTVAGSVTKQVLARLDEAVAWAEVAERLGRAERLHAPLLGGYYQDREAADFDQIARAIDVARRALALAGEELKATALQRQVGHGESPDGSVMSGTARVRALVRTLRQDLLEIIGEPATAALCALPIDRCLDWCARGADRLETLIEAKRHFDDVAGGSWPLRSVAELFTAAETAGNLRACVQDSSPEDVILLGPTYAGLETDWVLFREALQWVREVRSSTGALKPRTAKSLVETLVGSADLAECLRQWEKAKQDVLGAFLDGRSDEMAADLDGGFEDALTLLSELESTVGDIDVWSLHASALSFLTESGLETVTRYCVENNVTGEEVPGIVERAILEAWADATIESDHDRLSPVQASEREALVDRFRELDIALVKDAAARVVNACASRRPTSLAGPAGTIQREAQKQRRHMPIRELLARTGDVAQQLKPCFMMSPLSVSQYLPPSLSFDVVVFDEASQVLPSDAINCVYRAPQLIVAGDQKQLPPSNFFVDIRANAGDDIYDEDDLEDFESVLDLCKGAGGLRSLPLRWHYRSQHEKLITYSNYRFYEGQLHTFPGAAHEAPDLGLEVFKVDGTYRRGAQRDNPIEAAKVVERVLFHLHTHPALSLGVVTFSAAQEDAIVAELERQEVSHPELGALRNENRLRGFFVKSLEHVQGDERDVIIFSVGYGRDEHGKFTAQLGPLNKPGGWRRLNVAITRARRRVEVVTSVLPGDFPPDLRAPGVRHLRGYLDFALRGTEALALDLSESESLGDAESVFEEEVLRVLSSWGYEAVPQVGLAGYRIDIGVKDPRDPGRFLLGIECDGAMYHSSKVARDRDRLRQQVIEGLGWRVHRIWGISWFRDRAGQEARLRDAIETAVAGDAVRAPVEPAPSSLVVHDVIDFDACPEWATDYVVARPVPPRNWLEMHDPGAKRDMCRMVREVMAVEAPVHEERVLRAVREAWGVGRAGHRIRSAYETVLRELAHHRELERDAEGFLRRPDMTFEDVRVPTAALETNRVVASVPPEELDNAVYWLTHSAHAIAPADVPSHAARLFGWARTGHDITAAIEDAIDRMIEHGYLAEIDGHLKVVAPS